MNNKKIDWENIEEARKAAIQVLRHNMSGPCNGLPRAAGWGYPEPYTRDLMISCFGILLTGDEELIVSIRKVLEMLAKNQSKHGHIPSLVHNPGDRGASDTTPLFLIAVAIYRQVTGKDEFLEKAAQKAITWISFQSPDDSIMVAQQPTTDWRDEQWVIGYGLYVNCLVYLFLRLYNMHNEAVDLKRIMNHVDFQIKEGGKFKHEGFAVPGKPYYALWSYKIHNSARFDLLGNSLAVLAGIASRTRSLQMISWIESECEFMRTDKKLKLYLPPNFFPYVKPDDREWNPRYEEYNLPGEYHNGGIWPFVCGFYVAAMVAAGKFKLAQEKLNLLTALIKPARNNNVEFGFNEWLRAQNGKPMGQDWQSWSAAMYIYAVEAVKQRKTPFFNEIRKKIKG
jgi:hypothetical protein